MRRANQKLLCYQPDRDPREYLANRFFWQINRYFYDTGHLPAQVYGATVGITRRQAEEIIEELEGESCQRATIRDCLDERTLKLLGIKPNRILEV